LRVNLLHAFAHTDVEVTPTFVETPTPGYNLLKAEISYRQKLKPTPYAPQEINVGVLGTNLLNDDIRNSVSFTKDEVLMPGIGLRVFANVRFDRRSRCALQNHYMHHASPLNVSLIALQRVHPTSAVRAR
jgi:iron complex outermembrane receptor protein